MFMIAVPLFYLAVICLLVLGMIIISLTPTAISSLALRRKMRREGHDWVTPRIAFHLRASIGPDAFRIPRMEEVGVLPGIDHDPAGYLVKLMSRQHPYSRLL